MRASVVEGFNALDNTLNSMVITGANSDGTSSPSSLRQFKSAASSHKEARVKSPGSPLIEVTVSAEETPTITRKQTVPAKAPGSPLNPGKVLYLLASSSLP